MTGASFQDRAFVPSASSPQAVSPVPASIPSAWHPDNWPRQLDDDLRSILGSMCFEFIHLSRLYRAAGFDIPKRAEDEQAFFLHRYLGHWFAYGSEWATVMDAEIKHVAKAAQAIEARRAGTRSGPVHESAVTAGDAPDA